MNRPFACTPETVFTGLFVVAHFGMFIGWQIRRALYPAKEETNE